MTTLKDVARKAGVSTATVSYVLNNSDKKVSEKVAQRVREVARELDYRPNMAARTLRLSRTNIIGIISEDVTTYQVSNILQGVNQVADRENYQIILADLNLNEKVWTDEGQDYTIVENYREEIREKIRIFQVAGAVGIIYIGMHDRDITGLFETDMPLVYAYCYTRNKKDHMVNADNQKITTQAVEAMIRKGHRRIGLISGPVESVPAYKRLMGYQTALMQANLTLDPELIAYGKWGVASGGAACRKLMELQKPPTAIFCMNDLMAIGAMKVLKEKGCQIGKDVDVMGFDDIDTCELVEPALTTIRIPLTELGRMAADKMISLIQNKEEGEAWQELPCTLIERESFVCSDSEKEE